MYSLMFLGALAGSVVSQATTFSNTTFTAPVSVGDTWSISFSKGTGDDVAIAFGNGTYAFQIVDGLSAPGMYSWQVTVPVNVVPGIYQLALLQSDEDPVFSPGFTLAIPAAVSMQTTNAPTTDIPFPTVAAGAGAPITTATATTTATTTVTAIYLNTPSGLTLAPNMTNATIPMPIEQFITYIYWEDSCACHQTSSCPASALPTSMSTTTVTYSEKECGCTKTVAAPCAETTIPVAAVPTVMPAPPSSTAPVVAMSSSSVTPVMTTPAPVSPVAPANTSPKTYTGAAERVVASSLAFLAMVGALVLA